MENRIKEVFEETLNNELESIIISNSTNKETTSKVKIRPIILKEALYFQVTEYKGVKVFHNNYDKESLLRMLPLWFEGLFRQAELKTTYGQTVILISKKGKVTINKKNTSRNTINSEDEKRSVTALQHNKIKNYIIEEGNPLPFLIELGVMTKEGMIVKAKTDKFKQINRFLEYIEDILPFLDSKKEITILDFGCGKSYLTFAMYYYLKILKGYHLNIIGLDLKADVIEHCNNLSKKFGYDNLQFLVGDIASYEGKNEVDMVVSLHACDTATDYAIYKAVNWGARVILSVPCCQHEVNNQIQSEELKAVLKYGIIKERMAALITDALRGDVLELLGYRVQLLEFIDMEHTPKNILIRAVKRNHLNKEALRKNKEELQRCMDLLKVSPTLARLLRKELN